jgi:hypothetical protein
LERKRRIRAGWIAGGSKNKQISQGRRLVYRPIVLGSDTHECP